MNEAPGPDPTAFGSAPEPAADPPPALSTDPVYSLGSRFLAFLVHPLTRLAAVVLTLAAAQRWLFFSFSELIWAAHPNVPMSDITPWARYIVEHDGVEPQVLLFFLLLLAVLTAATMFRLDEEPKRISATVTGLCLAAASAFALLAPPHLPLASVDPSRDRRIAVVVGALLAALVVCWAGKRRTTYVIPAVLLAPACFVSTGSLSKIDLSTILAPALRLRLGFSTHQVYFQYDYLLSLMAVLWHRLGGAPLGFPFCTRVTFYLLLMGSFFLARRLFDNRWLAGVLVIALTVVRVYGTWVEANGNPQITPVRLDLWLILLATALFFGLRHWSVGLALGAICFFSRSFGTLYIGSYALALGSAFMADHVDARNRPPLWRELAEWLRPAVAAWIFVAAGVLVAMLVFGGTPAGAAGMYRRYGVGMMRVSRESFYWWVAPAVAGAGGLAFWMRGVLPPKRLHAALFLVALAMTNLIYFFGRSHEHNLINTSAPLIFCVFLAIDLAAVRLRDGPAWAKGAALAVPWVLLAVAAYGYSERIYDKLWAQEMIVFSGLEVPEEDTGPMSCGEVAAAVNNDARVFFYGGYDYWFYETCGYVPQGYIQPFSLEVVKANVIQQLTGLLNQGYKIVLPKKRVLIDFDEVAASLPPMDQRETANYVIYTKR
jgi:hypothetical protein